MLYLLQSLNISSVGLRQKTQPITESETCMVYDGVSVCTTELYKSTLVESH